MYLDHILTNFGFHDVIQFTNRFEYNWNVAKQYGFFHEEIPIVQSLYSQ
jgi:hypothetical protein